jgi:hypothetical protein
MKTIYLLVLALISLILLITVRAYAKQEEKPISLKSLQADLEANLPVGTPFDKIKEYFDVRKVECSYVEKTDAFYAIFRNIETSGSVSKSIAVEVLVDEQRRLKKIVLKPVYTGP